MVVGLDGSPGSAKALEWAGAHVDQFGLIQPVSAWQYPWWAFSPTMFGPPSVPSDSEFQAEAERVANEMLSGLDPADLLELRIVHGLTGPTVVRIGETASLIVVGTRGRGGVAASLLGSTSLYCVNHATTPVAVVPPDATVARSFERAVVGIDGSDNSLAALEWALQNTPPDTEIEAVYGWEGESSTVAAVSALAQRQLDTLARELVESAVADARRHTGCDRAITLRPECGDPRLALRDASDGADVLIVGARGRRGVPYLLLGSVASAVLSHPVVPTIVVR